MSIGDTTENSILKAVYTAVAWGNYLDNAASSPQTFISCSLNTGDPGDSGTMATSEITYTSYARVDVARTTGGWTVTANSVSPVASITFPAGSGGSGTAAYFTTGKTGGGATATLWLGTVTPNIICGLLVTPSLTTATTITLD